MPARPLTRTLPRHRHALYRLAPDLLLVFKPRGHREPMHAHAHRQRLRVLRGGLAVTIGGRRVVLTAASRPLTLRVGVAHATEALQDTWIVAESRVD